MRKILAVSLLVAIWSLVTVIALLWGFHFDWPDYVHTDYGLPLTWATNTTSTLAGPTNLWSVNLGALAVDLVIWLGSLTFVVALLEWKLKKSEKQSDLPSE